MTNVKVDRKDTYSDEELETMFNKAAGLKGKGILESDYYARRAEALLSLFGATGKRRGEVGALECDDLREDIEYLYVTFSVEKKRKVGQIAKRRTKRYPINSKYAQHIIRYKNWMQQNHPECKYLFPSIRSVFGVSSSFSKDKHLSGRQVLNIIKILNPNGWCHLFRETRAANVIHADEQKNQLSIFTVYKVKHSLDLEREATAWEYIKRYASEVVGNDEVAEEIQ